MGFSVSICASSTSFISFSLSRSDCINLIASLTGLSIRKLIWPRRSATLLGRQRVPHALETRPYDQFLPMA